ncbi:MAG: transporter, partial [Gammaproteobacteria bacterium]
MIVRLTIGFVFFVISGNSYAQYNGSNLRGDYGLFSGTQPGPGWYTGVLGVNYKVDSLRDRNGNDLASGGGLDVNAIAPYIWWVSDKKVFGGNYSVFASQPWANNSLEAPTLGISSDTDVGAGDFYIQPINLGWHTETADFMAGIGVFAPTGRYTDGASDNTGLGMWSYELFGGTTVYLDQARTWSFAATAFYETHSSKDGSDIKVGDILTIEGGLGKSWADGAAAFGVSYFAQWKVSEDELGAGISNPNKHKIFGAGPEL